MTHCWVSSWLTADGEVKALNIMIFPLNYSLDESTQPHLEPVCRYWSVELTDFTENCSGFVPNLICKCFFSPAQVFLKGKGKSFVRRQSFFGGMQKRCSERTWIDLFLPQGLSPIQSENIKHILNYEPILAHNFRTFLGTNVQHLLKTRHISEWVCCETGVTVDPQCDGRFLCNV